jgi:hypothetical protein
MRLSFRLSGSSLSNVLRRNQISSNCGIRDTVLIKTTEGGTKGPTSGVLAANGNSRSLLEVSDVQHTNVNEQLFRSFTERFYSHIFFNFYYPSTLIIGKVGQQVCAQFMQSHWSHRKKVAYNFTLTTETVASFSCKLQRNNKLTAPLLPNLIYSRICCWPNKHISARMRSHVTCKSNDRYRNKF